MYQLSYKSEGGSLFLLLVRIQPFIMLRLQSLVLACRIVTAREEEPICTTHRLVQVIGMHTEPANAFCPIGVATSILPSATLPSIVLRTLIPPCFLCSSWDARYLMQGWLLELSHIADWCAGGRRSPRGKGSGRGIHPATRTFQVHDASTLFHAGCKGLVVTGQQPSLAFPSMGPALCSEETLHWLGNPFRTPT